MRKGQRIALVRLARALHRQGVPFALGAGGLLYALGLTESVGDLDLFLPAEAEAGLRAAAGPWLVGMRRERGPLWCSDWIADLQVAGEPVEAVGGFACCHGGRRLAFPFRTEGVWEVEGVPIPLAPAAQWYAAYTLYKPHKRALLEPLLTPAERRAALRMLQ